MTENIQFLISAFRNYSADNLVWLLFLPAVIYLAVSGGRRLRRQVLWPLALMALTIFNPLFTDILVSKFGFGNRFHRMFWMVLYYLIIAVAIVKLAWNRKNKLVRTGILAAGVLVIVLCGTPVFVGEGTQPYRLAVNSELAQPEHLALRELFHSEGVEAPTVVMDGELLMNYRVVDPSVTSVFTRLVGDMLIKYTEEEFLERRSAFALTRLAMVTWYHDFTVPVEEFREAIRKRGVNIIVTTLESDANVYLEQAGLRRLGTTEHYVVWTAADVLQGE